MNIRFILFLLVMALIITGLVIFELNRDHPWDSDVFFGSVSGSVPASQHTVVAMYPAVSTL